MVLRNLQPKRFLLITSSLLLELLEGLPEEQVAEEQELPLLAELI